MPYSYATPWNATVSDANDGTTAKLADAVMVQVAATNRLAETAKRLGDVVKARTPDDRLVAAALDDLTAAVGDAVVELQKIKHRVTKLAVHQRAISPEDVTGVFDIPKGEQLSGPRSTPPGPYLGFRGWRIPLDGALWKIIRLLLPLVGGGGIGALVHHWMYGGSP
jgi:hypothetical protein